MSKGVVLAAILGCSIAAGWAETASASKPQALVRWHFAGTKLLSEHKDLETLRQVLSLPQTLQLRDAAIASFSQQAAAHFSNGKTNSTAPAADLIKPLLPDLIQNQNRLELTTRGDKDADWALGIKLPDDRVQAWDKNLRALAELAGMKVTADPTDQKSSNPREKWSASRDNYHFTFFRSKGWTLLEGGFGAGPSDAKMFKEFESSLKKNIGKQVLHAEVNFPLLGQLWSSPRLAHAPKVTLNAFPKGDGLRTEAVIDYPRSLEITPEKWALPSDLIRDPLVGFTAIQGVRGKLSESPLVHSFAPARVPNQIFSWSVGKGPFNVFIAADVGNPSQVITNVLNKIVADVKSLPAGNLQVNTNHPALLWRGLPIVVPYIEEGAAPDTSFLVGGLFPIERTPATNKPPAELFDQLKQKNLVYYEWEITEQRLMQWRPIWQLNQMLHNRLFTDSASDQWMGAAGSRLGNTITEVTLENPRRLKLVRQSQIGLNAFEILLLAHAVDPNDTPSLPAPGTRRARGKSTPAPRTGRTNPGKPVRPSAPKAGSPQPLPLPTPAK